MDCRFFLPHFSILCKQISDFRFWKNGCIFHNMQPDCVCKARFFSKNVPISAKKFSRFQAVFSVFHSLSEDFQQRFPQFVERQNRPKFWEFFWVSGIFPSPFSTKIRFFVSTVSTCDFLKNFCRSIFFEFSTKFSTSFSFQLHNLSTFQKWVMRFQLFHTNSTIALLKKKSAISPFFWLFHRFNSLYYYY